MRLFIGISIPDRVKKQISSISAYFSEVFPGKYTAQDTYHITLAYIGECDDKMRDKVICAMNHCALKQFPLFITTGKADYFGKCDKGILHLQADSGGELESIASDLREKLSASGLTFDPKPLNAHITLARKCRIDQPLSDIPLPRLSFAAMGLTLFHSCRVDDVLKYIPLHFEPFTGERNR